RGNGTGFAGRFDLTGFRLSVGLCAHPLAAVLQLFQHESNPRYLAIGDAGFWICATGKRLHPVLPRVTSKHCGRVATHRINRMTLSSFVVKNAFRNKRRSALTVLSIGFSLLLLTLMMTIWRTFYIDQGAPDSAKRLTTSHRVSLTFFLPGYYREKIRALPGVVYVAPMNWFGGRYKDDKPENFFAQFATDPEEYLKVAAAKSVPADQAQAWIRDRAGAMVDVELVIRYGWKIGDRVILKGTIFPVNPELTIRAIYTM